MRDQPSPEASINKKAHTPPSGYISQNPEIDPKEFWKKYKKKLDKITGEMTRHEVCNIYKKTIKNDEANIQVLFYGFNLNYTESDQLNFSITGPSSTGKTYLPQEILRIFPKEDIHWKGYTSPKAFYHERGTLVDKNGDPVPERDEYITTKMEPWHIANPKPEPREGITDWKEETRKEKRKHKTAWDQLEKYRLVDLHQKIEVFIDQPSDALQKELRPILSHDRKEIEASITDRSKTGQNRTKKVIIRGYATTVSSSTSNLLDEQEQTRHIQISPETSQEKFTNTLHAQSKALANPGKYKQEVNQDEGFDILRQRIQIIKNSPVENVIIRDTDSEGIYNRFIEDHPYLRPRHQRDFPRVISYIKAHALFNQWTREQTEDGLAVYANQTDIDEGFKILEPLLESNELGIPPHEYKFFKECLKPRLETGEAGLHRNDVSKMYYDFYKTRIGEKRRNRMIQLYLETGLVIEVTNPLDKRSKNIYLTPPVCGVEKEKQVSSQFQESLEEVLDHLDVDESKSSETVADELDIQVEGACRLLEILEREKMAAQTRPGSYIRTRPKPNTKLREGN